MNARDGTGYPWHGCRLAPRTLRAWLALPVPASFQRDGSPSSLLLADLDARAWEWFSADECAELADLVVMAVRDRVSNIVPGGTLTNLRLPPIVSGMTLADLNLSRRTYNALLRSPLRDGGEVLAAATISEVLEVRNFGAKGLVELLVALEEVAAGVDAECLIPRSPGAVEGVSECSHQGQPVGVDDEVGAFSGGLSEDDVLLLGRWCRSELDSLPYRVLRRRLPTVPPSTHVTDLGLGPRALGSITRSGHAHVGVWLADATIQDILALPHFGRSALRELLEGIVRLMLSPPPRADLTDIASAIAEHPLVHALAVDDPRFGVAAAALALPGETVREAMLRFVVRARDPVDVVGIATHLAHVKDVFDRIARQSLEEELTELAVCVSNERHGEIFARHRGWDGEGGAVLQAVGDEAGVTRERVRQISAKVEARLRALAPAAPVLSRTLHLLASRSPLWADELPTILHQELHSSEGFTPEVLLKAAEILGLPVEIRVEEVAGRQRVCHADDDSAAALDRLIRLIRQAGRRTVEHWGVGRIVDVAAAVARATDEDMIDDLVLDVLTRDDGFRWLDVGRGWFWNADVPRNRLTNQIDKVLCVAGALPVVDLRPAVARSYRMEGKAPPLDILTEFCRQSPGVRVDAGLVRADPVLAPSSVLAETELTLYEILKQHGSVMSRTVLEEVCRSRGMNRATFYVYLGNSPILVSPQRGVYALVGTVPSIEIVQDLAARRRRGRVLVAAGHSRDGSPWLIHCLSEGMLSNGTFGVPAAMKPQLDGDFDALDEAGTVVGRLSVREHGTWGLGRFLRLSEAEAGMHLAMRFDLAAREVHLQLGDEALVAAFASGVEMDESIVGDLEDNDADDDVA